MFKTERAWSQKEFFVDLHIHTNYSDGVFTPTQVVEYAAQIGLSAISITDHDTVDGVQEAIDAGKRYGVEVISGIELSAELDNITKTEMHILGYYVNWKSKSFNEALSIKPASFLMYFTFFPVRLSIND